MESYLLVPRRISEPWEVERMRQIFNATIDDLATVKLEPKSEGDQQRWWQAMDQSRVVAFLYAPVAAPWRFVAFSMLQWKPNGVVTPLFAVDPEWHGFGYGREIIDHYLHVANGPLAGSALKSNEAIMHLNKQAGWQVVSEDERVVKLYHPGVNPGSRDEEILKEILRYHGAN